MTSSSSPLSAVGSATRSPSNRFRQLGSRHPGCLRSAGRRVNWRFDDLVSFAVRSSATAEDLPDASFAGQQETFLNVRGIDAILAAIKEVFASLYNDRAIAYRVHHGFGHEAVALSAGVQRMVRSDLGASGVMFDGHRVWLQRCGLPDLVLWSG